MDFATMDLRRRTFNELDYALVMLYGSLFTDEIDFILEDDNVFEFHDFDGGEMLGCLRLGACLVARHEKERCVHDGGTVEHGGHQNIVTGTLQCARLVRNLEPKSGHLHRQRIRDWRTISRQTICEVRARTA